MSSSLHPAIPRAVPFAVFILLLALQPYLAAWEDPRWIAVARGAIVAALLVLFSRHYVELYRPERPPELLHVLLALATGGAVFVVWIALDSGWAVMGKPTAGFVPYRSGGGIDWTLVALRTFGLVLVVPIMEELFWRSLVMRWIRKRDFLSLDPAAAGPAAFALSSALFALEHSQWLAGLIAGAAYGWLYIRCRNLWIPILSHATTNALLATWILHTASWRLW